MTYLDGKLRAGQSVSVKKFGTFTFDISTDLPNIHRRNVSPTSSIHAERSTRKHVHKIR